MEEEDFQNVVYAFADQEVAADNVALTAALASKLSRWQPPAVGYLKINFHSSFSKSSGVGIGGLCSLVRNDRGELLDGLATRVVAGFPFDAELKAAKLACSLGVDYKGVKVEFEGGSKLLTDLVVGKTLMGSKWTGKSSIDEIKRSLGELSAGYSWSHCAKTSNMAASYFSSRLCENEFIEGMQWLDDLQEILVEDIL